MLKLFGNVFFGVAPFLSNSKEVGKSIRKKLNFEVCFSTKACQEKANVANQPRGSWASDEFYWLGKS
jgi:hypothetical protein